MSIEKSMVLEQDEIPKMILEDIKGMWDPASRERFYNFKDMHQKGFRPMDYIDKVIDLAIEEMQKVKMSEGHFQWYKMLELSLLMSGADKEPMERLTKELDKIRYADVAKA